ADACAGAVRMRSPVSRPPLSLATSSLAGTPSPGPPRPAPDGTGPRRKKTPAAVHALPRGGVGPGSEGLLPSIRNRTLTLVLIVLAVASAAGAADATVVDVANCHLVPEWKQQGGARLFSADNLFEYLNGN